MNSSFVRTAGLWLMIATVVGALGGALVGLFPNVTDPILVNGLQFVFFAVNAIILFGLIGFIRSGATGTSRLAQIGNGLMILGGIVHVPAELLIIWWPEVVVVLLPSFLLQSLGLALSGIAVLRANHWQGWQRFIPLIGGLYPFLVVMPVFAIVGYNAWVLVSWQVVWFFLGLALFQQRSAPAAAPATAAA